ncbi:MAG: hypothetical protein CM1200mP3_07770 [Chloroflexota bacterium]|nr:MAG: hypothetical protein CM1200mP3_07770 [Chloroflexota bacterium]
MPWLSSQKHSLIMNGEKVIGLYMTVVGLGAVAGPFFGRRIGRNPRMAIYIYRDGSIFYNFTNNDPNDDSVG